MDHLEMTPESYKVITNYLGANVLVYLTQTRFLKFPIVYTKKNRFVTQNGMDECFTCYFQL